MPTDDDVRAALAAQIAEIEAAGTGRSQRPRLRTPAPPIGGDEAETAGTVSPAADDGAAVDPRIDPDLPSRDVSEARGPALRDLSGQAAHDDALGVAPDGRPLDPGEDGESRGRKRRPKPATLAFSEPEPHQRAIELAFALLTRREYSAAQLRERLAKRGCEPPEIAGALAELGRQGFVDDRRYAKLYAEDKRRLQGWGARRIRMELGRAGIAREVIDELFADQEAELDAPSEHEVALRLLQRKQPDLGDPKARQRAAAMLARRGISSPVVFAALREHERDAGQ